MGFAKGFFKCGARKKGRISHAAAAATVTGPPQESRKAPKFIIRKMPGLHLLFFLSKTGEMSISTAKKPLPMESSSIRSLSLYKRHEFSDIL